MLVALLLLASSVVNAQSEHRDKRSFTVRGPFKPNHVERASLDSLTPAELQLQNVIQVLAKFQIAQQRIEANERRLKERAGTSDVEPVSEQAVQYNGNVIVDNEYFGELGIGTSVQSLETQWDTGSSDLWYPISTCNCKNNGIYFQQGQSSTYTPSKTPFSISYGDGTSASGTVATEQVTFGSIPAVSQRFGAVTSVTGDLPSDPATGLCGLAYSSLSAIQGQTSLPFTLMNAKALASNVFGVRYAHYNSGVQSLISMGAPATGTATDYLYSPVTIQAFWEIGSTGMEVNGLSVGGSFPVAIDTGSTDIYVPRDVAQAFYGQIPKASLYQTNNGVDQYQYPCSYTGSIGFNFAGIPTPILFDTARLNAGQLDGTGASAVCLGIVVGMSQTLGGGSGSADGAIVGDAFLSSVPTLFDMQTNRIGFISAVQPVQPSTARFKGRGREKRRMRALRDAFARSA